MPNNYLIEIGTQELPPTALKTLRDAFCQHIEDALTKLELNYVASQRFATPRRLAIVLEQLDASTPLKDVQVFGPPTKIAFDSDGNPTKAAQAFAKKNGTSVDKLQTGMDGKTEKLLFAKQAGGEATERLLGDIVRESLAALPIPKRMRWGSSRNEFVRPVQWILFLQDSTVINETILGKSAGNTTRGHRFHANTELVIDNPLNYQTLLLEQGKVIASYEDRQQLVANGVNNEAAKLGGHAVIDQDLLDEVTALVEWPVALAGKFDTEFLQVPAEALISSMKEHQKYFHILDKDGQLLANFITVANIESKDPSQVIDGNERVIRPRLADAAFFFETDKKTSLEMKAEKLKTVVFQAKLGTVFDKTQRIAKLGSLIAEKIGADSQLVSRAAQLCKADLVSSMVYEFTDLQGIAGEYYAQHDGEPADVAAAMSEQYLPKFAGDTLPTTTTGAIIALADRIDTITGIFGIGQTPTGSKDPFALRRASLGALRIMVEKRFDLDLRDLIAAAAANFDTLPKQDAVIDDVLSYMVERFKAWYEEENIAAEVFQAVNAKKLSNPLDINSRVHAVDAFAKLDDAKALAAANKRVSNILAKIDSAPSIHFDTALFVDEAEKALATKLQTTSTLVAPLLANNNYTQALSELAVLRSDIDAFFDNVMVMADDIAVRNNRLSLLAQLRNQFLEVADISYLDVKN